MSQYDNAAPRMKEGKRELSQPPRSSEVQTRTSRMWSFIGRLIRPANHTTIEAWEKLESRRSPQSIRAEARRQGTL